VRASELIVLIGGDASDLNKELKAAEKSINDFSAETSKGAKGVKAAEGATSELKTRLRELDRELKLAGNSSRSAALQYDTLRGSLSKAEDGLKRQALALAKVADANERVRVTAQQIGPALAAGVTLPLAALGKAALDSFVSLDSLKRGLAAVMGSESAMKAELLKLKEVAKLPGLGFEDAVQGSIRLQAAGLSAKDARESLIGFGNALATVGKGKAELEGVTLALSQIQAKGKVSAEEINQLAERLPQIREALKSAFGTSDTEKLQKMGIPVDLLIKELNRYFLAQKRVTGGIKNDLENASDSIKSSLAQVGEAIAPIVSALLRDVVPAIEKATAGFKSLTEGQQSFIIKTALAAAAIGPLVIGARALIEGIKTLVALRVATIAFFSGVGDAASVNVAKVLAFRAALSMNATQLLAAGGSAALGSAALGVAGAGVGGFMIGSAIDDATNGAEERRTAALAAQREEFEKANSALIAYQQSKARLRRLDAQIGSDGSLSEREKTYREEVRKTTEALYEKAKAERLVATGQSTGKSALVIEAENAQRLRDITKDITSETAKLRQEIALMGRESRANRVRFDFFQSTDPNSGRGKLLAITDPAKRAAAMESVKGLIKEAEAADQADAALKARNKAIEEAKKRIEELKAAQEAYRKSVVSDILDIRKTLKLGDKATEESKVQWEEYARQQAKTLGALPVEKLLSMRLELARQADTIKKAADNAKEYREALQDAYEATRKGRAEALAAIQGRDLSAVENFDLDRKKAGSDASKLSPSEAAKVRAQFGQADAARTLKEGAEAFLKDLKETREKIAEETTRLKQEAIKLGNGGKEESFVEQVNRIFFGESGIASDSSIAALKKRLDDLAATTGDNQIRAALLKVRASLDSPEFKGTLEALNKAAQEADAARVKAKGEADRIKAEEKANQAKTNARTFLDAESDRIKARVEDAGSAVKTKVEQFRASLEKGLAERLKGTSQSVEEYRAEINKLVEEYGRLEEAERKAGQEKAFENQLSKLKAEAQALRSALGGSGEPDLVRQARAAFESDTANRQLAEEAKSDPEKAKQYAERLKKIIDAATDLSKLQQAVSFAREAGDRIADAFLNGVGKIRQGFGAVFGSIKEEFENMLQDMARAYLKNQLSKLIATGLGKLFGVDAAEFNPPSRSGQGSVMPGRAYRINELEQEFFIPSVQGRMVSASRFRNNGDLATGSRGGSSRAASAPSQVINHIWHITTPDADSFRRSQPQIMREATQSSDYERRRS
jgi:tape measure domain-containing protein